MIINRVIKQRWRSRIEMSTEQRWKYEYWLSIIYIRLIKTNLKDRGGETYQALVLKKRSRGVYFISYPHETLKRVRAVEYSRFRGLFIKIWRYLRTNEKRLYAQYKLMESRRIEERKRLKSKKRDRLERMRMIISSKMIDNKRGKERI